MMFPQPNTNDMLMSTGRQTTVPSITTKIGEMKFNPPKQKKSVSFSQTAKVKKCVRLSDYTDSEHKSSWYSQEEMKRIKAEIKATVKLMEKVEIDHNDENICTMGLESRTHAGAHRKRENRRCAYDAVWEEQWIQFEDGISDPTALAFVCMKCTKKSQTSAHLIGLETQRLVLSQQHRQQQQQQQQYTIGKSSSAAGEGGSYHLSRVLNTALDADEGSQRPRCSKAA